MVTQEKWNNETLYEGPTFGLTVSRHGYDLKDSEPYRVSLPHQCDAWEFTALQYGSGIDFTGNPADALRALIYEATAALAVLNRAVNE